MADPIRDRDLAEKASRLSEPPPFDALLARARRVRRRNRVVTAVASTAVVLAMVGTGALLTDERRQTSPDPVDSPTPTRSVEPTPTEDARSEADRLTLDPKSRVRQFTASTSGATMTIYERCNDNETRCRRAYLVTEEGTVTAGMTRGLGFYDMYALEEGFLGMNSGGRVTVYRDGSTSRPTIEQDTQDVQPGDIGVEFRYEPWIYRESENLLFPAPLPPGEDNASAAAVTTGGDLVIQTMAGATTSGGPFQVNVHVLSAGATEWQRTFLSEGPVSVPGWTKVNNDHVVGFSTSDGATIRPLGRLFVSADGGETLHTATTEATPFDDVMSLAVSSEGRVIVTDVRGFAWGFQTDNVDDFERLDVPRLDNVQAVGSRFYARGGTWETRTELLVSDDGGSTWQELSFPGR